MCVCVCVCVCIFKIFKYLCNKALYLYLLVLGNHLKFRYGRMIGSRRFSNPLGNRILYKPTSVIYFVVHLFSIILAIMLLLKNIACLLVPFGLAYRGIVFLCVSYKSRILHEMYNTHHLPESEYL